MGLPTRVLIVSEVGQALTYAHEHNAIHGNIRPENVLFNTSGHAILTDFTLLSRKDALIRNQTAEEYAFCYMAPEQFSGTCDARSDQYALGCLAYELITGQVPFAAQSLATMMGYHGNARPVLLSERVADLLPSLDAAVLKALSKDLAERFVDCSLFLEIVRSALSPAPIFSVVHSSYFRNKRTNSRPVQVAEEERVEAPIRKRAVRRTALKQSKQLKPSCSGRRVLERVLLLSVIIALIVCVFLPQKIGTSNKTSLQIGEK